MSFGFKRALLFVALLAWCGAMIAVRIDRSDSWGFIYLGWNLVLAAVPAVVATFAVAADMQNRSAIVVSVLTILWLLFLPNAPYLVTDLIYVAPRPPIPLWYDVAMFGSCASTGLLLGYISVADIQAVVTRRLGRLAGWAVSVGALALSGFGIYLGRFLRWNSWDAFSRPAHLASDIAARLSDPGPHPHPFPVTLVYGAGLIVGYVALRVISSTTVRRQSSRPAA